jgi:hypothetical protein
MLHDILNIWLRARTDAKSVTPVTASGTAVMQQCGKIYSTYNPSAISAFLTRNWTSFFFDADANILTWQSRKVSSIKLWTKCRFSWQISVNPVVPNSFKICFKLLHYYGWRVKHHLPFYVRVIDVHLKHNKKLILNCWQKTYLFVPVVGTFYIGLHYFGVCTYG